MSGDDATVAFDSWRPPMPPLTTTADGAPRRIGVEIEMIGLDVGEVSCIVARHVGGERKETTRYEHEIEGDEAGTWGVELDYDYLKRRGRADDTEDELLALIEDTAERVVHAGARTIVPVEVVSPPLPMRRLADVQALIARLREAGAHGSGAGFSYAFGMQFNPEMPSLDADVILDYLKAFFCLYDWLEKKTAPDLTRRLTGYMAPFPGAYVRKVVDPGYRPGRDALIDDYLVDSPTRNRALDVLPLFLHVDKARLRAIVGDPRVKPRPTLHYRLPDCEIDRPDWGIHIAWGHWLQVEHLAADRERLNEACTAYARWLDKPLERLLGDWSTEVESWLTDIDNR